MSARRRWTLAVLASLSSLWLAPPARAVEYRLQVSSTFTGSYAYFLSAGQLENGASGPGLDRMEAAFDRGELPSGVILWDRRVQPVRESISRAWGGSRVIPDVKPGGDGTTTWDTITWDGKPGERSVWILVPIIRRIQEVYNAALKGTGPMRNYQPYNIPLDGSKVTVAMFPLNFLWFYEERGTIWDRYLARDLDLREGIGAVIGVNTNALFPDQVYIIVSHAPEPTTYKAVFGWRERASDRESPGGQGPIILR